MSFSLRYKLVVTFLPVRSILIWKDYTEGVPCEEYQKQQIKL
jgi:hypothetical protein